MTLVVMAENRICRAQTYSVLYSFGGIAGDGNGPSGTLIQDQQGNFYGTTQGGGANQVGTVFKLTPTGTETALYDFNLQPDAMLPVYGLLRDSAGNLYGAAGKGGTYGYGAIFKLDSTGHETVLHSFGKGADGKNPACVLMRGANGNLYGTTAGGGKYGFGTVFGVNSSGAEAVLHHFTGTDGATPAAGLIRDAAGNLLGTTSTGGAYGFGTVFKLATNGSETVLYSFCAVANCADGRNPEGGLVQDSLGNLFGTTLGGGANDQGSVFKLTENGLEILLYSFGAISSGDGRWPWSGLIPDSQGNLYGTTYLGGQYGAGTMFKLDRTGKETVLHSFCAEANCVDGGDPAFASLIRDRAGNLYGVAGRGAYQSGIVFKLTP
jgi:uncharacterized repeat protein (TIGR03803 family)